MRRTPLHFTWTGVPSGHSTFQEMPERVTLITLSPRLCAVLTYVLVHAGCPSEYNAMEMLFQLIDIILLGCYAIAVNKVGLLSL